MEVDDAVNVPPVAVGRVKDGGNLFVIKDEISRDAIEVNNGPFGPIVYNASRRGGRTVGTCGDDEVVVVPFVIDERRVC